MVVSKRVLLTQKGKPNLIETYERLKERHNITLDFFPFSEIKVLSVPSFRTHKEEVLSHTAVVFTSKVAIDSFFELCKACNIKIPAHTKYFLSNLILQNYLQKYIEIKKRKTFHGERQLADLIPTLRKHKKERFLYPCSEKGSKVVKPVLGEAHIDYTVLPIYENTSSNLSFLKPESYDVMVFFTPLAVEVFRDQFPDHHFNHTAIAVFGENTAQEVEKSGWEVKIKVPSRGIRSMVDGLEAYFSAQK